MPIKPKVPRRKKGKTMVVNLGEPVKTAIVRAVRRANPQELKFVTAWNGQSATADLFGEVFNSLVTGGTNYPLLPPMLTGTDVGQRIGNKIRSKKLVVDFWVNATNYQSSVDMIARLFILESKNIRSTLDVTTISLATMLDYGQAQGGFNGYTTHLSAPVNRDEFKIHMDRVIKLNKAFGNGPALANTYVGDVVSPQSNSTHHIRVNVKCPATLGYATTLSQYPEGFAPFFNAGYAIPASQSGTDVPDITLTRLQVCWMSTLYYTDD